MHSSRFEYEISLISIVQPTNRTKHKTKQNKKKKNQTHKLIQSQNTIKFRSFLAGLTVLLQIQYRNQNRKQLRETKLSLIFHACFSATKQWTVGTKQLTFFFSFERPRRLKACCGLIKAFGEGWLRQRVRLTERTMRWRSRWVRAWVTWISVWEGETVSESVRVCVCSVWEREWGWGWVRVQSDLYEVSEALFLKIPYLKSSIRHSVSL